MPSTLISSIRSALVIIASCATMTQTNAQTSATAVATAYDGYPEEQFVGAVTPWYYEYNPSAIAGETPPGITALPHDLFTTTDFYADRALWTDKRYYRCNSPIALDSIRGDYTSGPGAMDGNNPATAAWGHCERDYPRQAIVSPYGFTTAQAHYEALLQEANSKGGPTQHTAGTLPAWNGRYTRNLNLAFALGRRNETNAKLPPAYSEPPQWVVGWANQMPTILSLLTPEYQQRFVQQMYHKVNSNSAQNSLMFCRPEGLLRWWSGPGGPSQLDVTLVPGRVQFMGGTDNALRQVQIDGKFNLDGAAPRIGADVRRWLGETIGFWDGAKLVTWTSNVQGWFTHGSWEYSSAMQLIEVWSERHDANGALLGLQHETVFYDPEAFVEPVRDIRFFVRQGEYSDSAPLNHDHCNQTIFLGQDGRAAQVSPGTTIPYTVRDLYDRPWARIWEQYFEQGMSRPVEDDSLGGFQ